MTQKICLLLSFLFISITCFANSTNFEEGLEWKQKGNLVEAIKFFEKAKDANPNDLNIAKEYANAAYKLRRYVNALPVYEKILESEPKNVSVLTRLAKMYSYSSQKFKSVEYADKAVKLNPTDPTEQIELADAFYFVKHYPKAIDIYKKIQPANEYTLHKIAKSYDKMSAYHSAIEYFAKLIELKKEPNATLYYEYGNALFNNNNFKLATKAFLTSKEKGFYNHKLINENIALGFFALKAYEPALEFYLEAKKSAPYDKNLNLDIADCYNRMGRFKEARDLITKMQETNPTDGDLMYAFGMTYYKEGKTSKAETYFNKAFVMKPSLKALRYTKSRF
jgi:tetratricopeptide (TPR) repeat protein